MVFMASYLYNYNSGMANGQGPYRARNSSWEKRRKN